MTSPLTSPRLSYRLLGALGALGGALAVSGCPGTLDPQLEKLASETGGSSGGGGTTGSGGSSASCTGGSDGATIVAGSCASTGCHDSTSAAFSGGLDLTVNSGIGARLVGVTSQGTTANGSSCLSSTEPYLAAGSNPATGLLIDKTKSNPPCGSRMPLIGFALSNTEVACLTQWATTLTSP